LELRARLVKPYKRQILADLISQLVHTDRAPEMSLMPGKEMETYGVLF
jgi:hypothetical protein